MAMSAKLSSQKTPKWQVERAKAAKAHGGGSARLRRAALTLYAPLQPIPEPIPEIAGDGAGDTAPGRSTFRQRSAGGTSPANEVDMSANSEKLKAHGADSAAESAQHIIRPADP